MIRATCHTVDDALTVEFDATPWFREAELASIVHVARQGWTSAWIADALEKRPGYERLHELIDYATNRLGQESQPAWAGVVRRSYFRDLRVQRDRPGSDDLARCKRA